MATHDGSAFRIHHLGSSGFKETGQLPWPMEIQLVVQCVAHEPWSCLVCMYLKESLQTSVDAHIQAGRAGLWGNHVQEVKPQHISSDLMHHMSSQAWLMRLTKLSNCHQHLTPAAQPITCFTFLLIARYAFHKQE